MRAVGAAILSLICIAVLTPYASATQKADWTIMVYMNGKNDLESAALTNFKQMAEVGSTDRVHILAELGRPEKVRHTTAEGNWTGVLRFRVTTKMRPLPSQAIAPDDSLTRHADMGDARTLARFVQWGKSNFPAKRYMVVVWNHGQGWRLYLAQRAARSPVARLSKKAEHVRAISNRGKSPSARAKDRPIVGGYRAVSFDDDTGSFLYNRAIAEALSSEKVDLIGFDACLMGMIETAYAFRSVASVLVASEELVPGAGWPYNTWLSQLLAQPSMDEKTLGRILVESYKNHYGKSGNVTLSAVDLAQVTPLATQLSAFASLVQARLNAEHANLMKARQELANYADWYADSWTDCSGTSVMRFHGVDLGRFLDLYGGMTKDQAISGSATNVRTLLDKAVLANYASEDAATRYGSSGVAIYFPGSKNEYMCDVDHDAYDAGAVRARRVQYPPEFVEKEKWADLLGSYLNR